MLLYPFSFDPQSDNMPIQYAIALCNDFLQELLAAVQRLPAPATGALLVVGVVCLYESLGNSRMKPGRWR